jgi:hypothetical protein
MHQNPWRVGEDDITFDEEKCIQHYAPKWDEQKVYDNALAEKGLNYDKLSDLDLKNRMINPILRKFDRDSIMLSKFDADLTFNGKGTKWKPQTLGRRQIHHRARVPASYRSFSREMAVLVLARFNHSFQSRWPSNGRETAFLAFGDTNGAWILIDSDSWQKQLV